MVNTIWFGLSWHSPGKISPNIGDACGVEVVPKCDLFPAPFIGIGRERAFRQSPQVWRMRNRQEIALNQTRIWLYSPCTDWFLEQQTDSVCLLFQNQSKNYKYNLISVWFDKIWKIFLCVYTGWRDTDISWHNGGHFRVPTLILSIPTSTLMFNGFLGGPQSGSHDAERRQILGHLYVCSL